jgi:hypothetical protein
MLERRATTTICDTGFLPTRLVIPMLVETVHGTIGVPKRRDVNRPSKTMLTEFPGSAFVILKRFAVIRPKMHHLFDLLPLEEMAGKRKHQGKFTSHKHRDGFVVSINPIDTVNRGIHMNGPDHRTNLLLCMFVATLWIAAFAKPNACLREGFVTLAHRERLFLFRFATGKQGFAATRR